MFLFVFMLRPPPTSTLFPYTTLFRSGLTNTVADITCGINAVCSLDSALTGLTVRLTADPLVVASGSTRSEEHTSELQSRGHLVCRLLLEKKKNKDST